MCVAGLQWRELVCSSGGYTPDECAKEGVLEP